MTIVVNTASVGSALVGWGTNTAVLFLGFMGTVIVVAAIAGLVLMIGQETGIVKK